MGSPAQRNDSIGRCDCRRSSDGCREDRADRRWVRRGASSCSRRLPGRSARGGCRWDAPGNDGGHTHTGGTQPQRPFRRSSLLGISRRRARPRHVPLDVVFSADRMTFEGEGASNWAAGKARGLEIVAGYSPRAGTPRRPGFAPVFADGGAGEFEAVHPDLWFSALPCLLALLGFRV